MELSAASTRTKSFTATLISAQQKLDYLDVPLQLRLTGFLRISCSLLPEQGSFSKLMAALTAADPQWGNTCMVTSRGTIHSSNQTINALLAPVMLLYYNPSLAFAA